MSTNMSTKEGKWILVGLLLYINYNACEQLKIQKSKGLVTVLSKVGNIAGFTDSVNADGNTMIITKFTNIPFAETTAGRNRFLKPLARPSFTETFLATGESIACFQGSLSATQRTSAFASFSEDCLILNIYVPHDFTRTATLPVMLWVHGGGFTEGASALYNGEVLCAFSNLIVVTINYRLGMFGFLQSADGRLPGNQGLWDQHLAIKWVHENIAAFTGDPNQVTLFGESAGAASVLLQAMFPGNRGYFQRVIAESGSPLAEWALMRGPNAEAFIASARCESSVDSLSCLRSKTTTELQKFAIRLAFYPSVDGDFLLENPKDILFGDNSISSEARNFYRSLDILSGVNDFEGAMYMVMIYPYVLGYTKIHHPKITHDQLSILILWIVDKVLLPTDDTVRNKLKNVLINAYVNWTDPFSFSSNRMSAVTVTNDAYFFSPAILAAQAHAVSGGSKTYFYKFGVNNKHHILKTPHWIKGSNHLDEIPYVFCKPLDNDLENSYKYSEMDKDLSRAVATMWSNFARTGNPNTPDDLKRSIHTTWPEYTMSTQKYLQISYHQMSTLSIKNHFHEERMALWSKTIPTIQVGKQ